MAHPSHQPPGQGPYGIPQPLPQSPPPYARGGIVPGVSAYAYDDDRAGAGLRGGSGADGFDGRAETHAGPPEEGFAVGHVTGYRVWSLTDDATLAGMNAYIWRPGTNTATCTAGHTKIPFVQSDVSGSEAGIRREIEQLTEQRNHVATRAAQIREQATIVRLNPEGDPIVPATLPALQYDEIVDWVRGSQLAPSRFIFETPPEAEAEAARLDELARQVTDRIATLREQIGRNRRCGCGFWAYWALESSPVYDGGRRPVVGAVAGTGRVILGTRGFRCAKARLLGVYLAFELIGADGHPDPLAKTAVEAMLAETYGVPVFATRELLYATFPPSQGDPPAREAPSPDDQARWAQRGFAGAQAPAVPAAPAAPPPPALTAEQMAVQDFLTGKIDSIESGPPGSQAATAFQRAADAAMKARGHMHGWSGRVYGS